MNPTNTLHPPTHKLTLTATAEVTPTLHPILHPVRVLKYAVQDFRKDLLGKCMTLGDLLLAPKIETFSWEMAKRIQQLKRTLSRMLDHKIESIRCSEKEKLQHQVELSRFDEEGGALSYSS